MYDFTHSFQFTEYTTCVRSPMKDLPRLRAPLKTARGHTSSYPSVALPQESNARIRRRATVRVDSCVPGAQPRPELKASIADCYHHSDAASPQCSISDAFTSYFPCQHITPGSLTLARTSSQSSPTSTPRLLQTAPSSLANHNYRPTR